jgi:hypothetical protein
MMVENLAFVLLGLSVIVGVLTFVGAHNSPIPMPNISKSGCLVAVGLLVVGFTMGLYSPVSNFNSCAAQCEEALDDMDGEHGEFDVFVAPGRVDYKACYKGAKEADAKAKQVAEEQGDPSLAEPVDPAVIEARCMGQARDHCTVLCFDER